ncbi:MAG: hypothetical protein Q8L48_32575 [Archangium sp.]|nr:hypothetical protein [Archangium sp.]
MTKKAEAKKPAETKVAEVAKAEGAKKPKVHVTKPSSNPFTAQNPGRVGRSANGGTPGSRRGS